jgi:hypothetical protein
MRSLDEDLSAVALNQSRNHKERDRARQQAARARDFDSLVRLAFDRLLPVRLVINEGDRSDREKLGEQSSHVHRRALDPEPWYVHAYNDRTGSAKLVRALLPARDVVDAAGIEGGETDTDQEDKRQLRAILVRRGQREAAHITPHSVEPNYRTSNGLLLRADIHTLYDLTLLSIDEYMRVHLAPALQYSEYKNWEGKRIERRPDQGTDAPATEALHKRHAAFLDALRSGNSAA